MAETLQGSPATTKYVFIKTCFQREEERLTVPGACNEGWRCGSFQRGSTSTQMEDRVLSGTVAANPDGRSPCIGPRMAETLRGPSGARKYVFVKTCVNAAAASVLATVASRCPTAENVRRSASLEDNQPGFSSQFAQRNSDPGLTRTPRFDQSSRIHGRNVGVENREFDSIR